MTTSKRPSDAAMLEVEVTREDTAVLARLRAERRPGALRRMLEQAPRSPFPTALSRESRAERAVFEL